MRILTMSVIACLVLSWLVSASPALASAPFGSLPDVFEPPAVPGLASAFPLDTGKVDHEDCEISIRLYPSRHFLEAETRITFRSLVAGLGRVQFALYNDTLRITSVTSGPDTLSFSYDAGSRMLTVQLDDTLGPGERDTILVRYSGYVTSAMGNYCRLDNSVGFSMLPYAWYPTAYDLYNSSRRDDFSSWRITLTVPRDWRGLSCGVLLDSAITDSTQTYVWHPTKAYVAVSFGAGPHQMCTRDWGELHLRYYDTDTMAAGGHYAVVGTVLDYLNRTFGPVTMDKLAFFDHKASFGAAHPSLVMMPLPNELYPLAHEIGHHWWGISVTRRYNDESWLNEGFASYMSALLYEDSLGLPGRREVLDSMASNYLAVPPIQDRPMVPAPFSSSHLVAILYSKGAWVLHMLRGVLGDSVFFEGMKTYATTYRDSAVVIDDFRLAMEQVSGRTLVWFFNQWLYRVGAPAYAAAWRSESLGPGNYRLTVVVNQTDSLFDVPLPLSVFSSAGRRDTAIRVSRIADTAVLTVPVMPDSVVLDYDDWVLDRGIEMAGVSGQPTGAGQGPPTATIVRGVLFLAEAPSYKPQAASWLLDAAGRKVLDLHPGANDVSRLTPGVYFMRGNGPRAQGVESNRAAKVIVTE